MPSSLFSVLPPVSVPHHTEINGGLLTSYMFYPVYDDALGTIGLAPVPDLCVL